jgi:hypothetical protein
VTEDTRRSALSPRAVFGTWRDSAALTLTVDQWGLLGCVLLYAMWFQRDEPFLVDRLACRCAKYRELAVEFASLRFS